MKRILVLASFTTLAGLQAYAQTPLTSAPPPPAGMTPPPAGELPLAVITEWAQSAIAACKANGYDVTATYMDTDFVVKLVLRSDAARLGTVELARRKAYTVIKTGLSSGDFAASVGFPPGTPIPPPAAGHPMAVPPGDNVDQNLILFAGGLPVLVGAKIVGAVSVSGAPGGDNDAACAETGLAKIASQLK
jgi:uncharacterized protein GlcG (DUF336 family)